MSSRFKNLKKQVEVEHRQHYHKFIVIGHSRAALRVLHALEASGESDFIWLTEREVNLDYVDRPIPSTIRGESNVALAQAMFGVGPFSENSSIFYKDMKFRAFGGRSKSMPLQSAEVFYTASGLRFKELKFLATTNLPLPQIVSLAKIEYLESSEDLLAPRNWSIQTKSHDNYQCQYLLWASAVEQFVKLIGPTQPFQGLTDFLQDSELMSQLYVSLEFDHPISEREETLFIPLSLTHAEGHFIGGWVNSQRADFIHFFDGESCDETDIIKKIRGLKRSLEKIFSFKDSCYTKEFYAVDEVSTALSYNFQDRESDQLFIDFPSLFFIGPNAPLRWDSGREYQQVSHFMREQLSFDFWYNQLITTSS